MDIFNLIKRILHIGGPQIDLVTRDSIYYPSDLIRGEILITAPDYRQNIKSVTISLKEFWIEYLIGGGTRVSNRADRYHQHDSLTIVDNCVFLPRMKYQFPFQIRLPTNCRVSSEESGWRLGVVVSAFESLVFRADFNINVQLSRVLQTIIRAIEKDLQFIEIPRGRKYIPDFSATRFIFRPPEHLQSELEYLELDVSLTDEGGIKGNMMFMINEDGSFSQFASNTGDNCSHEFHFKQPQLFDAKDQVDTRTVTNIISCKLMETLSSKSQ